MEDVEIEKQSGNCTYAAVDVAALCRRRRRLHTRWSMDPKRAEASAATRERQPFGRVFSQIPQVEQCNQPARADDPEAIDPTMVQPTTGPSAEADQFSALLEVFRRGAGGGGRVDCRCAARPGAAL